MQFIINGMKYNTDKMEKMADVKKWYQIDNLFMQAAYPDKKFGRYYDCELWKSQKGNWLLTHEADYKIIGQAITEEEAKELLMRYATDVYEKEFEEIPEA